MCRYSLFSAQPVGAGVSLALVTAQDLYRVLVRDHFGPALRAEGLTGSGAAWMVPSDTHFALLGWQKRRSSTAATVEFTANLKVVSKATWFAQDHPKGRVAAKPEANLSYGLYDGVTWEHRIGVLMGVPHGDHWWSLHSDDRPESVVQRVLPAVTDHALPALRQEFEAQRSATPLCEFNVGYRNDYRHCGSRPEVALGYKQEKRRAFFCQRHADERQREDASPVVGTWPTLM